MSGADWQLFRFAEPRVTFNELPGGDVFWVEFDAEDPAADHDPKVWNLSEKPGARPVQRNVSFTGLIASYIEGEVEMRSIAVVP